MMDWIALLLALIGGSFTLLHRAMVSKIYHADGKALSTFTLPRIIAENTAHGSGGTGYTGCHALRQPCFWW